MILYVFIQAWRKIWINDSAGHAPDILLYTFTPFPPPKRHYLDIHTRRYTQVCPCLSLEKEKKKKKKSHSLQTMGEVTQ